MSENREDQPIYSFQLISAIGQDGLYVGYLAIREVPNGFENPSKYGIRLDIPGSFRMNDELVQAGRVHFDRFNRGEVGLDSIPVVKEKLRGYRITGTARFQLVDLKWEPVLEIKKMEEPNRGAKQIIMGPETVFPRNLYRDPELAAKFAVEFGRSMVTKSVNGLQI